MVAVVLLALPAASGMAADLIPIPDFTDYELLPSETSQTSPRPDSPYREALDLAAFCGLLAAATIAALKYRRRWALLVITVVAVAWLGFWRGGCICPIGAIQNVALVLGDPGYAIPLSAVVLFSLPLVVALFFGRTFCAAVCPLGALQELVALRPVRVPEWLEYSLGVFPWVYLGLAVVFAGTGTAFIICRYDPFVAMFRLGGDPGMLVFGGALLLVGIFVGRPYCRFLCPYGALLGLCSRVARCHVTITPDECIECRLCEDACPYGAIQAPTVAQTSDERLRGRRRLAALLVALPLLILGGFVLGRFLDVPLSRLDSTVLLAERVLHEETGRVEGTTDASDAFRGTGRPAAELYREANQRMDTFRTAGAWLGAWLGMVVGTRLVYLSLRRKREAYEPVRTHCVSCGRCFRSCPKEMLRLGLISDVAEVVPAEMLQGAVAPPASPDSSEGDRRG